MMPFGGLFQTITWSRGRAEKKHTELTGMSTASSRGDVSFGELATEIGLEPCTEITGIGDGAFGELVTDIAFGGELATDTTGG